MRTLAILVATTALMLLLCPSSQGEAEHRGPIITGGWNPIPDVDATHIQELGSWALTEYFKLQAHQGLKFAKVVRGERQVVAGMNYKLDIKATGNTSYAMFEAVIYESLTGTRQLLSCAPIN